MNSDILLSQVDFDKRKINIVFYHDRVSLRQIVQLLAGIGYEPYISYNDINSNEAKNPNRNIIYKLGVSGFCFSNIMLLSFPEYLGLDVLQDPEIANTFRVLIIALSLPVFFYSASEFFINSWLGIKNRFINIDAPVSIAIIVTFFRSIHDLMANSGPGFLDSMSGIVFFMLLGRYFQGKTKDSLDFNRDYKSYFPVSVNKVTLKIETPLLLNEISKNDILRIRNLETIPVDGILISESADIDYSFITGESAPSRIRKGELLYQGGRVLGEAADLMAMKKFDKNAFVDLWNSTDSNKVFEDRSVIHQFSHYFSYAVFAIAGLTAAYWAFIDKSKILDSATSVLIIACPCLLLLASSFTNGFLISLFAKYGLYFKNYLGIERMAQCDQIVFDKTGTLTLDHSMDVEYSGFDLTEYEKSLVKSLASKSTHPYSRSISQLLEKYKSIDIQKVIEIPGGGIIGTVNNHTVFLGSKNFVVDNAQDSNLAASEVYFKVDQLIKGRFNISQKLRDNIANSFQNLEMKQVHVLSGDKFESVREVLSKIPTSISFKAACTPMDKVKYIQKLNLDGSKVIMVGDGLNDAGALNYAYLGVSVMNENFSFSPGSDALLEGKQLYRIPQFLKLSKFGQKTIKIIFIYSFIYNFIGLAYAVSGHLKPLVAAILMPISSLSIIFLSFFILKMYEFNFRKPIDRNLSLDF